MIDKKELRHIHTMFHSCAPLFIALGDEIRQQLILDIADAGADGINVSNLTAKTHLSRPAISHHLKVLRDCGLIQPKKTGTQIFYQLNLKDNLEDVNELVMSILNVLGKINSAENAVATAATAVASNVASTVASSITPSA
jgi:DNA-binding transcriptional ArsR family regulator